MKNVPGRDAFDRKEAAASWFARLRDDRCSARERASFEAWHSDPQNAEAYSAVEDAWAWAGAGAAAPEVLRLREEAARLPRRRFMRWQSLAAAGVAALALGAVLWAAVAYRPDFSRTAAVPSARPVPHARVYSTAVGERSTVTLDDGSIVFLNTDSRLRNDYSAGRRHVVLLQGQALFEVATMADRPFVVTAGERRVVALGTAFDVRLEEDRLQVTLIEGRVSVEPVTESPQGPPARAELEAGQQLIASPTEGVEVREAPVGRVTSWREGRLIFEDEPLARAVREMNRYSTTKIRLSDPRLESLRVSGVFRTGQPQVFVEALIAYFPIGISPASSSQSIVLVPEGRQSRRVR